ncbi:peptidyl-prolyl cis-trans isomerase, FKBP-type family protein [Tritrichomonas foetus]|uniref:peptidylprolyl isomerase n=1 Tax=Tritrichomonas foetus TaxID=1144522 RepID=A0A1J4L2N1_9EUKA|nr:peptidyl-prolyl cis-trans isomerase, FKBP-type family protein [Tritrichomonas foetus]|eukprot:OHT16157.1 peptidyl-prolyl cis-trans isomerase, FKBP-type family protein [Tritrichomonas foetus]
MSGLMNLFGSGQSLDNVSLRYDPNKQRKQAQQAQKPQQQQQQNFPFQSQVQLFHFDTAKNENQSYGVVVFLIQPMNNNPSNGYQLLCYKEKDNPFVNCQITSAFSWNLRNKIYGYLKEPSGIQWTVTFADAQMAARASVTIGAILSPIENKQVSNFDVVIGNGATVSTNDSVTVAYMGFSGNNLPTTGSMFDSNENYNFVIGTNKVIKGYSIGVDGMKVGGSRVVLIPPEFGYGIAGAGGRIPPNATLAFFITLNSATTSGHSDAPQQQAQQQQTPQVSSQKAEGKREHKHTHRRSSVAHKDGADSSSPPKHKHRRSSIANKDSDSQNSQQASSQLKPAQQEPKKEINPADIVPTADEEDLMNRIDTLSDLIKTKYDSLILDAPVPQKPRDLVYEVQALAAQIAGQDIKMRKNQDLINELNRTKKNSRLKAELDIVQAELNSLKASLKGGMDYRRENEELKKQIRDMRENEVIKLQGKIAELRTQITNEKEISRAVVGARAKDLFYQFMGTATEKIQELFVNTDEISAKQVVSKIYDVFHQCSEEIFHQIDAQGMLPKEEDQ